MKKHKDKNIKHKDFYYEKIKIFTMKNHKDKKNIKIKNTKHKDFYYEKIIPTGTCVVFHISKNFTLLSKVSKLTIF